MRPRTRSGTRAGTTRGARTAGTAICPTSTPDARPGSAPDPGASPARSVRPSVLVLTGALLAAALAFAGCTAKLAPDEPLTPQFAEAGCLKDCRTARAACDREARHAWRDCQAGYAASFEDYRWCLASGAERRDCGYPWWSCAENGYRACREDQQGCERACDTSGAVAWRPPGAEG